MLNTSLTVFWCWVLFKRCLIFNSLILQTWFPASIESVRILVWCLLHFCVFHILMMIWAWRGSRVIAARTLCHCAGVSPGMAGVQPLPLLAGLWSALGSCAHPQSISFKSLARPSVPSAPGTLTSNRRLTHVGDDPEHCTVGVAWFSLDQARMLEGSPQFHSESQRLQLKNKRSSVLPF